MVIAVWMSGRHLGTIRIIPESKLDPVNLIGDGDMFKLIEFLCYDY